MSTGNSQMQIKATQQRWVTAQRDKVSQSPYKNDELPGKIEYQ